LLILSGGIDVELGSGVSVALRGTCRPYYLDIEGQQVNVSQLKVDQLADSEAGVQEQKHDRPVPVADLLPVRLYGSFLAQALGYQVIVVAYEAVDLLVNGVNGVAEF
jgi:hypothetical protein